MNFLVEVCFQTTKQKEISQETSGFDKEWHTDICYDVSKACAMAQEIRPQRLVSASSCFLPALLKR